jgi:hypothetical protein
MIKIFKIHLNNVVQNGKLIKEIFLRKNKIIFISVFGINGYFQKQPHF